MKKIFILTGEPSGDKLASKVIQELKKDNSDIEYLSVGGENLQALGIKSIYDLKDITFIGFTNVIKNIFKLLAAIPLLIIRAKRMHKAWPWSGFETYMDQPIADIRKEFNIKVLK